MASRARLVLLLWLASASLASALPEEGRRWYRLDSDGVTAFTDGDPDRAEQVVRALLRFRASLDAVLPGGPPPDGRPLVVHLFESEAAFRSYKPLQSGRVSEAAGFFLARREGAFTALRLRGDSGSRIVRHELVHHHLHRLLGGAPPWLEEGLAEYLSAGRVDEGALLLGEPIPEHAGRLGARGRLPVEKLVRTPVFAAAHSAGGQARDLYAQSWALVHWLRTSGSETRELFEEQLAELRRRGPQARDLVELAGRPAAELQASVAAHLDGGSVALERLALPPEERRPLSRRRLDRGESLTALGELLLAVGRAGEAAEHFEAARRARSSWGRAWRGLGLVREASGDAAGARPLFEAAAERAPRDPEVLLSLGRNLLGVTAPDFDADRVPPGDASRAREILARAVELAPNRAESLAALGLAGLMTSREADPETGAALEVALERLPHRGDVAYHLLLWHLRRDELGEAQRLLEEAVLPRAAAGSELAVRALNAVTLFTLERARELAAAGRREEARRLLDARREAGVHESLRPQVLRLLRELR